MIIWFSDIIDTLYIKNNIYKKGGKRMTLYAAIILLILAVAGIVLVFLFLRKKPKLRIICLVVLSLIALALVGYIALCAIFIYAIQTQPPTP